MAGNKTCKKCDGSFEELYQDDYCYDCYSQIWSDGFEVTSDWGASIAHRELISELNEIIKTDYNKSIKIVKEILDDFLPGAWICEDCFNVIIATEAQENIPPQEIVEILKKKCDKCGLVKGFDHEYKGAY